MVLGVNDWHAGTEVRMVDMIEGEGVIYVFSR